MPILLLVGLELVLRVANFGYSPRFFVKDGDQWRENPKAVWNYMPRQLARTPSPLRVARQQEEGTVRLVVFGESAALGDPEPAYGFARYLETMLEDRYQGTDFEVVQTAITAINSHVIRDIANDARGIGGDYWLFLIGNNEYAGPFGPATTFGRHKVSVSSIRMGVVARRLRLGQALEGLLLSARSSAGNQANWEGLSSFRDQRIHPNSKRRDWVNDAFAANLAACLKSARKAGAEPIVAWTPVNLADCAPFADGQPEVAERARFREGQEALTRGDDELAISIFEDLTERFSRSSEAWYWLGKARAAGGDEEGAAFPFRHAREMDALPLRVTSALNENARSVAEEAGARWVDPRDAVALASGEANLGREALFEHAHFTPRGNYGVALAFAESIESALLERGMSPSAPSWLDYAEANAHLGMSDWEERFLWIQMRARSLEPPLNQRRDNAEAVSFMEDRIRSLSDSSPQDAVVALTAALERRPDDWLLLRRRGLAHAASDNYADALVDLRAAVSLIPDSAVLNYQVGLLMRRVNTESADEARSALERALSLRPSFAEAHLELAKMDIEEGAHDSATTRLQEALTVDPNLSGAREAWVEMSMDRGDWATALEQWEEGLSRSPSEPRILRFAGVLLSEGTTKDPAQMVLEKIAMVPETGGAALKVLCQNRLRSGAAVELIDWLGFLIKSQPGYLEARYELAVAYIARGALLAAVAELKIVTDARPNNGEAWFNLGVAYAKLGKNIEAVVAFDSVPNGDPNAANARQYAAELRRALGP